LITHCRCVIGLGILGLTERERKRLDLICARRSNDDIAAKSFLSAKTVAGLPRWLRMYQVSRRLLCRDDGWLAPRG